MSIFTDWNPCNANSYFTPVTFLNFICGKTICNVKKCFAYNCDFVYQMLLCMTKPHCSSEKSAFLRLYSVVVLHCPMYRNFEFVASLLRRYLQYQNVM